MKNKSKISCFFLFFLFIIFLLIYLIRDTPTRLFERHLGELPQSVHNIETEGATSLGGGRIFIWFDITPSDLEKIIMKNKFKPISEKFLKTGKRRIKTEKGEKIYANEIEYLKHKAKSKGINPDIIYVKEGSSQISNYYLLIVNVEKNKAYYLYHRF